jgi:hypothetical protein
MQGRARSRVFRDEAHPPEVTMPTLAVFIAQLLAADPTVRVVEIRSPLPCSIPLASSGLVQTSSFALELEAARATGRAVVTRKASVVELWVTDGAHGRTVSTRYVVKGGARADAATTDGAPPACRLVEVPAPASLAPPEPPTGCFWSWTPGEDPTLHVPLGSQCVLDVPGIQRIAI